MRIVTRPDFDGVVCAALLYEVSDIREPTLWVEPNELKTGQVTVKPGDIIANLPYHPECSLWFDHHYTNRMDDPFDGAYKIAPSAAGVIYEHYNSVPGKNFDELIRQTDRIDAADLTEDEVRFPEKYPYILLSMTFSGQNPAADEPYWNRMVQMLRTLPIETIMADHDVRERCERVVAENSAIREVLLANTVVEGHVSTTDFRGFKAAPKGNRYLVYSLFPDAIVSIKIRNDTDQPDQCIISVGHSIFNRKCRVNVGKMLSAYGGGGHRGAGACKVDAARADATLSEIRAVLAANQPDE